MTDQQLALEAMSEAQRILEECISNPDRTITSASWTGSLRGPTSLSPSTDYSTAMIGNDQLALLWQILAIDWRNWIPESDFQ